MCDGQGSLTGVTEALAMLSRALDHLNTADVASLPTSLQADALRALGQAEAKHTAARARLLGAFAAQGGCEDDGHGTARTWLKWQTRVTHGAAAASVAWARRLAAHPVIAAMLASAELSPSWARQICEWTDQLPDAQRADADEILAGAARGGAGLAALGGLAREMYERCVPPEDRNDRLEDRWFRLGLTFGGAGRAEGDLTPGCAAALAAVLDGLAKKAGPEDIRTREQRRHDALEEACRRLIRAGMVPGRAGQPTQVQVHLTLGQLRGLPTASAAEGAWAAARASQPGWLTGPEADAAACDATIVPIVTGHVDSVALDRLTETFLRTRGISRPTGSGPGQPAEPGCYAGPGGGPPSSAARDRLLQTRPSPDSDAPSGPGLPAGRGGVDQDGSPGCGLPGLPCGSGRIAGPGRNAASASAGEPAACGCAGGCDHLAGPPSPSGDPAGPAAGPLALLSPATRDRLRRALLGLAADALSGPDNLAARLRAALDGRPLTSVSLPLDIGAATETIPAHLRRAVTTRHPHCAFPGCDQPASVCDIHHLIPRSRGGPTSLPNLVPLCGFHHLTAIHRWGWTLTLRADGTTTATSPDGTRTLHSHGPPGHSPPGDDPPGRSTPVHAA
jgi:hypothetical protein